MKQMHVHAAAHPRWGYRKIHALLVDEGWAVNVKRIERLWRAEGLRVPPRRLNRPNGKGIGQSGNSAWARPAVHPGHIWSYDFVALRTQDGRPLRLLNVVDEYTRRGVGFDIARSIGSRPVKTHLGAALRPTRPARTDPVRQRQGVHRRPSCTTWLTEQGVSAVQVAKASPQQNCYVERFNGIMRDELLDGELFHSVLEAKVVIGRYYDEYNNTRPHRGLGMMTPAAFDKAERTRLTNTNGGG